MPSYSGKYEFRSGEGAVPQSGACSLAFDRETLRLITDKGPGIALDLGDICGVEDGEYQLCLRIYDSTAIQLNQFGRSFQNMRHELLEAWRARVVQCLLLEDLEEVTRVDGFAQLESTDQNFSGSAEIRLYKSNIAVLPVNGTSFQWRLADIDSIEFDEGAYALLLKSGKERLILTRLARRSREFHGHLLEAAQILADKSTRVLHALFPFLSPGQFMDAAAVLKEGRTASVSGLNSIHPSIEQALFENAVGPAFRPYFTFLKQRAATPGPYFGFKLIRKEDQDETEPQEVDPGETAEVDAPETEPQAEANEPAKPLLELEDESLFFWFMFPVTANAKSAGQASSVTWECTSQTGRATYLFNLPESGMPEKIDEAVQRLNRAIVMVNFRREPIYLPDASLEIQPRWRRYAIAKRNIPALRDVRQSFVGRAIHTSLNGWQSQLQSLLAKK